MARSDNKNEVGILTTLKSYEWFILPFARLVGSISAMLSFYGIYLDLDPNFVNTERFFPYSGNQATELGDDILTVVFAMTGFIRVHWLIKPRSKVGTIHCLLTYVVMLWLVYYEVYKGFTVLSDHPRNFFFAIYIPFMIFTMTTLFFTLDFEEDEKKKV